MILLNKQPIVTEQFPNNETKVKDFDKYIQQQNLVEFTYQQDGDLILLMFIKQRLDEAFVQSKLFVNYMPYSRMDRKIEGDLFTLKYICQFINHLKFSDVYIVEPHSHKTLELLDNSTAIYPALEWLPEIQQKLNFTKDDRIIFPDKGAAARYQNSGYQNVCIFEKTRNPFTGQIENMTLKEGNVPENAKCIIVDDLCAAGGTFIWAGNILKEMGASDITLLVTHCESTIFKGKLIDENSSIDRIYTTTSMMNEVHPKINYITINTEKYV